jgi:hypothetical protein
MALSVPVTKAFGNHTATKDILISQVESWKRNHWRAIKSAYLNSPYFEFYADEIEKSIFSPNHNLVSFTQQLNKVLLQLLGIDKQVMLTTSYIHAPRKIKDLRNISPKKNWFTGEFKPYIQVFDDRHDFIPNLSIIDLLFNLGPGSKSYLEALDLSLT